MGAGSYLEFVVKVKQAGDYELSVALSAEGPSTLSTTAVVNDARQADAGYPMKKLLSIEKNKTGVFELVLAGSFRFDQAGLHLLRFSSEVERQILQIDRIRISQIDTP